MIRFIDAAFSHSALAQHMGSSVVVAFFNLCVNCVRFHFFFFSLFGCVRRGMCRTKKAGAIFRVSYTGIILLHMVDFCCSI